MSAFPFLMKLCGLSQTEAAAYLKVALHTVQSWSSRRREPHPNVIAELANLARSIDAAAQANANEWSALLGRKNNVALVVSLATSDADARRRGFPCVGAHGAAIALAIARMPAGAEIRVEERRLGEDASARVVPAYARARASH